MWLLVRAADAGDGVLASCPETAQGRETWQWTISRTDDGTVLLETDPDRVQGNVVHASTASSVTREPGSIVAFIPASGTWEVASSGGPWSRTLAPGDVFLAEDDREEALRLTPADGAVDPVLSVATLRPIEGGAPLRWIP